jgi:hypothetical protein
MFSLSQDEALRILEMVGQNLSQKGQPAKVVVSYLSVLPLLVEHAAIQNFVRLNPQLEQALPEVLNQKEAVRLMSQDQMLSQTEANQLLNLLPVTLDQLQETWGEPIRQALAE